MWSLPNSQGTGISSVSRFICDDSLKTRLLGIAGPDYYQAIPLIIHAFV